MLFLVDEDLNVQSVTSLSMPSLANSQGSNGAVLSNGQYEIQKPFPRVEKIGHAGRSARGGKPLASHSFEQMSKKRALEADGKGVALK
jgi:hypothetical protein